MDQALPIEERFRAQLKLAALPRNSAKIRIRNRCEVTGRPRAYYRKLKMSPYRAARTWQSRARSPAWSSRAGKEDRQMTLTDPLGDMLTRIRNALCAARSQGFDAGLAAACPRSRRAEVGRLHPRLQPDRLRQRQVRDRDRAEVFRRRAGDPRDRARLASPAAASMSRSSRSRRSPTASASRSCRPPRA